MDAGTSDSCPPAPAPLWLIWAAWACVLGIAVCAVLSAIEIDRLGY